MDSRERSDRHFPPEYWNVPVRKGPIFISVPEGFKPRYEFDRAREQVIVEVVAQFARKHLQRSSAVLKTEGSFPSSGSESEEAVSIVPQAPLSGTAAKSVPTVVGRVGILFRNLIPKRPGG